MKADTPTAKAQIRHCHARHRERGERERETLMVYCLWLKIALSTRGVQPLYLKSHTCSDKNDINVVINSCKNKTKINKNKK